MLANVDWSGWTLRHLPEASVEAGESAQRDPQRCDDQIERSQSLFDRDGMIDSTPKYFEQLSEDDQKGYTELRRRLFRQRHRDRTVDEQFGGALTSIQNFCDTHDDNYVFRSLVCGIVWIPRVIVVNTDQLSLLLGKDKNVINTSFGHLGYSREKGTSVTPKALRAAFPVLTNVDWRRWTVRYLPKAAGETGETVETAELDRQRREDQLERSPSLFNGDGTVDSTAESFDQLSEDDQNGSIQRRAGPVRPRARLEARPDDFGSFAPPPDDSDSDSASEVEPEEPAVGIGGRRRIPTRDAAEMGDVDDDGHLHRDSQNESLPDDGPWGRPLDYQDEPESDDDGDLPAPPDAAPSAMSSNLRIFDPRTPIQYIRLDGSEVHMTIVHDQLSYWTGGLLTTVDTRTGSMRTVEIVDVVEVSGNTEDNTFVLTNQSEVFLASVYERPYSILRWGEGHLSKLTAGHSNEPIFAVRSGKTLVIGTQIGHQPIDFKGEIVDIELSDHYLYVSTDQSVTLMDTDREIGSYVRSSGVKSFCLLDGRQKLGVWGDHHLDIIDIRTSGTSCQRYDLGYDIDSIDLTICPKLLAISGGESVSIVDWRFPLNVVSRIDCSLRHGGALGAKWLKDTEILVIASEAGPTELYDFGGLWEFDIESFCEASDTDTDPETETGTGTKTGTKTGTETGTGNGNGNGTGAEEGNGYRRGKEEIPSGPGRLVRVETSSGWGIVQKGESITFIQNPADRVPATTTATTVTAKTVEPNVRVRRRYETKDPAFAGLFDW
jgi:hypothetical protein